MGYLNFNKKLVTFMTAFCLFFISTTSSFSGKAAENNRDINENASQSNYILNVNKNAYLPYLNKISSYPSASEALILDSSNISKKTSNAAIQQGYLDNSNNIIILNQESSVSWDAEIPQAARYSVQVKYSSYNGKSGATIAELFLNDELPCKEAGYIEFKKLWKNGEISEDIVGNQMISISTELLQWQTVVIQDPSNNSTMPMQIALDSGKNNIKINIISDNIAIEYIRLIPVPEDISYTDYKNEIAGREASSAAGEVKIIEAQNSFCNSDITIKPANDPSSPYTSPQRAGKNILNIIGGLKWQNVGQSITWEVNVENSGYYNIGFRARQRTKQGISVSRTLKIDGETPFSQARDIKFDYSKAWYMQNVTAENETCEFYFEKGKTYKLSLEVNLGGVQQLLFEVEDIITNLNQAYFDIFMIVGASPDVNRDYEFAKSMPETMELLKRQKTRLKNVIGEFEKVSSKSEYTSLLNNMLFRLERMLKKPTLIASMFVDFKTNIGSMSEWLSVAKEQPLELDRIYIIPSGKEAETPKESVFTNIIFSAKCFFATFMTDYTSVSKTEEMLSYDSQIKVWSVSGRDQAIIVKRLADEQFSQKYQTGVNVEVVTKETLLPAVLSGVGPDVCIMNEQAEPINYAIRNAAYDLNKFSDLDEVLGRFEKSSIVHYQFEGHTYALPETLTFNMFFYRKDIFDDLQLEVPETWNDLVKLLPQLQQYKLEVGLPTLTSGYFLTLAQRDIPIYLKEGKETNLGSDEALSAFKDYCSYFTIYQASMVYDFLNRFRTGEMPCAIADYTRFNDLNLYAPEIKGLWDFIPIPGVYKKDGSLEHTAIGSTTASMILSSAKSPDACWDFLKWWLSAEIQGRYAVELESVLGPSAKYPTANVEAFENMTWTVAQKTNIVNQMKDVKTFQEVPGGYYTTRVVDFAVKTVFVENSNPIATLTPYLKQLNDELKRKRAEFSLK